MQKVMCPKACLTFTFIFQDNWSALMFAAKNGALEISIELLERGASLEHRDLVRFFMTFNPFLAEQNMSANSVDPDQLASEEAN